jgi:hypothetical protein
MAKKHTDALGIQERVVQELAGMQSVNGIGIACARDGRPFIRVNLTKEDRSVRLKVRQLSVRFSLPIRVRVVGMVRVL